MNSRRKGAAGERELAAFFEDAWNIEARRAQQFKGTPTSQDLEIPRLPGIAVESKRGQRVNLYAAIEKTLLTAGQMPLVCWRKNGKPWLAVVYLENLPSIGHAIYMQQPADLPQDEMGG